MEPKCEILMLAGEEETHNSNSVSVSRLRMLLVLRIGSKQTNDRNNVCISYDLQMSPIALSVACLTKFISSVLSLIVTKSITVNYKAIY